MSITLSPVTRPNARIYRPRKLRIASWDFDEWGYNWAPQTAVLGTHDVDLAARAAKRGRALQYLTNPTQGWLRLGYAHGERQWIADPDRGAAAVIFDETEDADSADQIWCPDCECWESWKDDHAGWVEHWQAAR